MSRFLVILTLATMLVGSAAVYAGDDEAWPEDLPTTSSGTPDYTHQPPDTPAKEGTIYRVTRKSTGEVRLYVGGKDGRLHLLHPVEQSASDYIIQDSGKITLILNGNSL
jgi:hypothetical protein